MQTFIVDHDMAQSAKALDNKRLGKQRVEATQILNTLLGLSKGWQNHPAVKMWKGYEEFLLHHYLAEHINEWAKRGFDNTKTIASFWRLTQQLKQLSNNGQTYIAQCQRPPWITDAFIEAHRSNLICKDPLFYGPKWPQTKENLPYIWPASEARTT